MNAAVVLRLAILVALAVIAYLLYKASKALDDRISLENRKRLAVIEEHSFHRHPRLHLWFPRSK